MKLHTLAALGLLLFGATAFADTAVYDLDASNARAIAEALRHVLTAQCTSGPKDTPTNQAMCQVELLPTGQLLVEAPAASQAQVAAVLKAIAARSAKPALQVTLQYWVLYGEPGKPDATDGSLKPINAVLQQLKRAHGELGFSVQDTVSITTQSGFSGVSKGGPLTVNETLRASGDDLDLLVSLAFAPRPLISDLNVSLNVSVTIKRGEFLVLGERTAVEVHTGDKDQPVDVRQKAGMLFFVVHWQ
jgi:hypothetical protein